jgi:hypothetical protein
VGASRDTAVVEVVEDAGSSVRVVAAGTDDAGGAIGRVLEMCAVCLVPCNACASTGVVDVWWLPC